MMHDRPTEILPACRLSLALYWTMVGATGFEPATSCSRSRRSTGLSYAPPICPYPLANSLALHHAPGETRTPNLLIRSQMLYPIELRARIPVLHPISPTVANPASPTAFTTSNGEFANRTVKLFRTPTGVKPIQPHRHAHPSHEKPRSAAAGNGRYKTRTCDLHDVNVAL